AESIDVRYSASLILRNAGGTQVTRSGPLASTPVVIVGSIAQAGTVSASEGSVDLVGTVRIATTTTGAGALPSLQVPAAALSAVVSPAASDHAVAAFDTTTAVPGTITAPAMTAFSMQLTSATADSLPG